MSQWRSFQLSFLAFTPLWLSVLAVCGQSMAFDSQPITTEIGLSASILFMLICSSIGAWRTFHGAPPIDEIERSTLLDCEKQKTITSDFILACVLPLYTFDFTNWCSVLQFLIIIGSILILYAKYYGFPPNVVLELCRYSCFKCQFSDGKERFVLALSLDGQRGKPINLQALSDSVFIYRATIKQH